MEVKMMGENESNMGSALKNLSIHHLLQIYPFSNHLANKNEPFITGI